MEYKYLLMADSEFSEYKDVCSLDLKKSQMYQGVYFTTAEASNRERFDKTLLGFYRGRDVRQIYQLMQWISGTPSVWDDEHNYPSWDGRILYSLPPLTAVEADLVNQDLLS